MRTFENQVQKIKHKVYKKVCEYSFDDILDEKMMTIAEELNQGPNPTLRCCVYHERAVTNERVYMSIGGSKSDPNLIEVLSAACDQCTENRYLVTEGCRGCIAHRCEQSCLVNAITFINNKAIIDYSKCIECGKCHSNCPYNAISDVLRPCIKACPTKAISIDKNKKAVIDESKCIRCGACVYKCPFGAIQDKSQITQIIQELRDNKSSVYAIIAPAIATQFEFAKLGQVVTAMKILGFKDVIEVALGADLVAIQEAEEFVDRLEKKEQVMTSSCCPGFVRYIHQEFPELKSKISSLVSPMIATARMIKNIDQESKIVFVGPCIAKKGEQELLLETNDVDYVMTFEELTGMIESKDIDLTSLECAPLNNGSYYGRKFATTGGVTNIIKKIMNENHPEIEYDTLVCDGITECKKALTQAKFNRLKKTFIEGMACEGGCIKGPATMHYGTVDNKKLNAYCLEAMEKTPQSSVRVFESKISLHR